MTEAVFKQELLNELKAIRKDLTFIKKHMVDADTLLTSEERARLDKSIKEHKAGKSIKLEDFEKTIGR